VADSVVIDAFTELAPHYEATVDREVREFCGLGYREFVGYLASMVPMDDGDVVLDVACGTGVSSSEIVARAGKGTRVVGLDITPAMLQHGLQNIEAAGLSRQVSLLCGSAMEMPLASGRFDVVVCGLGMHHMDATILLRELNRVLLAGGHLVMADMAAPAHWRSLLGRLLMRIIVSIFRLVTRSPRAQAEADAFSHIHSADEWHDILSGFGYEAIDMVEWPPRRFWYPSALIMKAVRAHAR
jgi:ubiquinone/menaquinone biosynthesis C-methylase UbiE